ncbi:MAG: hypothetical protein Q8K00_19430 [Syntrophales bacterium]|nr:hypothetical protein [Syntrophales bacterium]
MPEEDAIKTLHDPVRVAGKSFDPAALHEIFRLTRGWGYPYSLQEWATRQGNHAAASPITRQVVQEASKLFARRLDENFFRGRFDRLSPREKMFLRAMGVVSLFRDRRKIA